MSKAIDPRLRSDAPVKHQPRDMATDPRPGDVVTILPGWTRKVIQVDDQSVTFRATEDGDQFDVMKDSRDMWKGSVRSQPAPENQ